MRKVSDIKYLYLEVTIDNYIDIFNSLCSMGYSNITNINKLKENILGGKPYIFICLYNYKLLSGSLCRKDLHVCIDDIIDIIDIGSHSESYIEEYYRDVIERYLTIENMGL